MGVKTTQRLGSYSHNYYLDLIERDGEITVKFEAGARGLSIEAAGEDAIELVEVLQTMLPLGHVYQTAHYLLSRDGWQRDPLRAYRYVLRRRDRGVISTLDGRDWEHLADRLWYVIPEAIEQSGRMFDPAERLGTWPRAAVHLARGAWSLMARLIGPPAAIAAGGASLVMPWLR